MMSSSELDFCLTELDLTQTAAAKFLSVDPRTVRRWVEDTKQMPGAAVQALRAWVRLKKLGAEWRPNHVSLGDEDRLEQLIDDYRRQAYEIVDAAIKRVEANGGPKTPWHIDIAGGSARLGMLEIYFYETGDERIAPNSYTYLDGRDIDTERDCQLIDDAYYLIVQALRERKKARKH